MDIDQNTYCNYMVIISPPDEVKEMIRKYKKASARVIGPFDTEHSIAHISLTQPQRLRPALMKMKLDYYQNKLKGHPALRIRINGFDYFKHGDAGYTIYAVIEQDDETASWFAKVAYLFGDKRKITPHITIVKNIPGGHLETLWPYFTGKNYEYCFWADKITVLYRPMIMNVQQNWMLFKELSLKKEYLKLL